MKQFLIHSKIKTSMLPVLFFSILIVVWQIIVQSNIVKEFILPSPSSIIRSLIEDFPIIFPHLLTTLTSTLVGMALAGVIAFFIAILIDISKTFKNIVYPIILLFQIVPIIIFAPILIIWLGYGIQTQLLTIVLMVFFPLLITLCNGFALTTIEQINLFKSMGASKLQIYYLLKIPNAIPSLFAGIRMAITYAITAAVISEWIGAIQGLGVLMIRSQKSFLIARVFAINLIILLVSVLLYLSALLLEKKLLPWKKYMYEN